MPATDHLPRTLGPYRLQDRLGEGGMGVVHLARDPEGRAVAVKVLHPLGSEGVNARRRLTREVETMRRVRSPYVAEVVDADVTGEFPYIVTRFVSGPTLDEMVRTRGPLSGPGLRRLAHGMAEALSAIHAAGVVHRDLKPGNVMLTDDRPIVIDFGIAQAGDATRLTQTGLVMGTPGYLAPEVIEGEPSSPASDVHSWGSTMAFAATGHLPFGGGSYETIFYRIISGRADLSGVPAPLVPLISAALARDPSHRPSAGWLSAQAVTLDMSAATATATCNGAAVTETQYPREAVFIPAVPSAAPRAPAARAAPPPAPKQAARDVADLLPPVSDPPARKQQKQQPYQDQAGPWGPQGPRPAAAAPAAASRPAARPNTAAGLAIMVALVALTVVLPVAGLLVSLAVITLLRAADRAQSKLAVRRSVRGPRASDLVVVLVTAPLTVARALLTEVLMAPLAIIVGAAAYGLAVVVTHSANMPRAGAYAAAAVVAWYGLGPGSSRPRRQLNRMAGVVARTRTSAAAITLSVWALAVGAVLFASSQTPYYWPAVALPIPGHLPSLHHLILSASHWLLRYTHL
jgi:predicted Ser/Thr protein kinase